jgi:hypothetical protein
MNVGLLPVQETLIYWKWGKLNAAHVWVLQNYPLLPPTLR